MKFTSVTIAVLLLFFWSGCLKSVRRDIFPPIVAHGDSVVLSPKVTQKPSKRFTDTVYVKLNSMPENFENTKFSAANTVFDEGNYTQAQKQFIEVVEDPSTPDSIRFEALFMVAECSIQTSDYTVAYNNLMGLNGEKGITPYVHEKVLLRLGQLLCTQNDTQKAQTYFNQLKSLFPQSRFLPLATCNSIK